MITTGLQLHRWELLSSRCASDLRDSVWKSHESPWLGIHVMRCIAIIAALLAIPSNAAEIHDVVPDQFLGTWAASAAQCASTLTESKLVISGKRIAFYASEGPILSVVSDGALELALILELSGEGQTWVETKQFRLSEDRRTLTDVTGRSQTATRIRCEPAGE